MMNAPEIRFRRGFVLVMTLAYAVAFIALVGKFFVPLVMAAVFCGVVYPLFLWFDRKLGGRRNTAATLTLVVSILVILIPSILLLGMVAEQALEVGEHLTPWIQRELSKPVSLEGGLPDWLPFKDKLEPYAGEIQAKLAQFTGKAGGYLAGSLAKMTQGTASFFFSLFVMLYAMFFFLQKGPSLLDTILGYFPLSKDDKSRMVTVALSVSRATIKGTLVIGMVQGALGGLGFAVAGIQGAAFWAAFMAILSIIPGIGATLVWAPAVIYLLMTGQTVAGLGLLAWSAGVVSTIDNVLRPRLVGRDTEMPDLLIFLSTLGGLVLFGAPGLVLGPILAALFLAVLSIYSRVFQDWLNVDEIFEEATPNS